MLKQRYNITKTIKGRLLIAGVGVLAINNLNYLKKALKECIKRV